METLYPFFSYLLGVLTGIFTQWISYLLSLKATQKQELWIRKLNSYQDFYQYSIYCISLLQTSTSCPPETYWGTLTAARKAALDAAIFDNANQQQTNQMNMVTLRLMELFGKTPSHEQLNSLEKEIDEIFQHFRKENKF